MPTNQSPPRRYLDASKAIADSGQLHWKRGIDNFKYTTLSQQKIQSGSKGFAHYVSKVTDPDFFIHTVPPAAHAASPTLLDFAVQGRTCFVWGIRPAKCPSCPSHITSTKLEARGWEHRLVLDLDDTKVLLFRRYTCKLCEADHRGTYTSTTCFCKYASTRLVAAEGLYRLCMLVLI